MPKEKCFQSNLCQSNLCSFLLEAIQTTADKEKSTPLPTSMWEDPWGGLVPGMAQHGKIHFLVTKMTLLQFRSIQPPPDVLGRTRNLRTEVLPHLESSRCNDIGNDFERQERNLQMGLQACKRYLSSQKERGHGKCFRRDSP